MADFLPFKMSRYSPTFTAILSLFMGHVTSQDGFKAILLTLSALRLWRWVVSSSMMYPSNLDVTFTSELLPIAPSKGLRQVMSSCYKCFISCVYFFDSLPSNGWNKPADESGKL